MRELKKINEETKQLIVESGCLMLKVKQGYWGTLGGVVLVKQSTDRPKD